MSLGKKERRFTIAIGLIIGVTASSMLVKHALEVKDEQAAQKPGNYNSQRTAVGNIPFQALPKPVILAIPNGVVIHYEENRTSLAEPEAGRVNSWVIETTGSFRSERLFILAEQSVSSVLQARFYRSAEIYLKLTDENTAHVVEEILDEELFRIIGKNNSTGELIVQTKKFSPTDLENAMNFFTSMKFVKHARLSPWVSSR